MSGKIKTLLVVLALGALISVSYLFSGLKASNGASLNASAAIIEAAANDSCKRDTDHDGLADCQETYWQTDYKNPDTDGDGFLDGEEVLSGHSPTKKGPDDFLGNRGNVTHQAATLLLGGLSTGDLSANSPNYASSVQALSGAVLARYQANSQIPDEEITIGGSTRADIIAYGFAASRITGSALQQLSSGFTAVVQTVIDTNINDLPELKQTNPSEYQLFIQAIEHQVTTIELEIAGLKKLSVPPAMATSAKNVLALLRGTQQQYRLLHQIAEDPMQGVLAFQSIGNLTSSTVADVAQDFAVQLNNALSTQ